MGRLRDIISSHFKWKGQRTICDHEHYYILPKSLKVIRSIKINKK
uniref:Uncharacterized protein n=1 Tax=Anguilla anguilla TaxID=7936 RepID=A0A0E9QL59_ANGAN